MTCFLISDSASVGNPFLRALTRLIAWLRCNENETGFSQSAKLSWKSPFPPYNFFKYLPLAASKRLKAHAPLPLVKAKMYQFLSSGFLEYSQHVSRFSLIIKTFFSKAPHRGPSNRSVASSVGFVLFALFCLCSFSFNNLFDFFQLVSFFC